MKKRVACFALAALLVTLLVASALAAETPQVSVTWLTREGKPYQYNEGLGWLTLEVDDNSYYVIDLETQEQISGFDCVEPFHEGLARAARKDSEGGWRYGYLDKNGETVIPLIYTWGSYFREGMAVIERDGKRGYIDKSGTLVIPCEWDDAGNFADGLAFVVKEDDEGNGKCGYVDKTGALKSPLEWDQVYSFCNGMARVGKTDAEGNVKWGYIDTTGALKIPCEWDDAENYSEGLACVSKADANGSMKWGYIDAAGTMAIPIDYEEARPFTSNSKSLALVRKANAGYSCIDKTGAVIIPLEYDFVANFNDGLAWAYNLDDQKNVKWGVIDQEGKVVIPLEYDEIYWGFFDGIADVCKVDTGGNKKWGYINKSGETVLPLEYDATGRLEGQDYDPVGYDYLPGHLCWVKKGNSYGYFIVPEEKKPGIGQVVADLIGQGKDNKDATPVLSANTSTEAAKTGKGIPAVAAGVAGTIVIVIGVIFVIKRKTPRK